MGELLTGVLARIAAASPRDGEAERIEMEERAAKITSTIKGLIASAGERFRGYTLQSWAAKVTNQRAVKQAVIEWLDTFEERKANREGLVLYGPVGTGKDHLAFGAVAAAVMRHGCTAAFRNGRDLMAEARDRIGAEKSERQLVESLSFQDVLILSDPLPVKGELTDYQADTLYRLVDNRAADGKLTVCTLNVADDAEADKRLGAATWDRLCDRAWKLACFWESHRKPAREIAP